MKVLKIGAEWCSGCVVMRPRWQKIEEYNLWLETIYYDYDASPEIVQKYNLGSGTLPTFIFLDEEESELERLSGEVEIINYLS